MPTHSRLDAELVRRGLARSRQQAVELVTAGQVRIGGQVSIKPAQRISATADLAVESSPGYVSRGGYKLASALNVFDSLAVEGRRCLDAGASTGGFTDVLLRRGAQSVVAVDVGSGQLAPSLSEDPRVTVVDRVNVRALTPAQIGGPADLTVADLSFISLALVLPALVRCTRQDGDLVPMVKPQFEAGRADVPRTGVVRDLQHRAAAILRVAETAGELGFGVVDVVASALPGPAGNVEYFLWLRADAPPVNADQVHSVVAGDH